MNLPNIGNKITPHEYQLDAYRATTAAINQYTGPFYLDESVNAGKTYMMGMIAARAVELGCTVLVLARKQELVEQNQESFAELNVKTSIFCSGSGYKSTYYPVVIGSEKTVYNALQKELKDFKPRFILFDECHEVGFENPDSQYMKIHAEFLKREPQLITIGYSGSPYRNSQVITGDFWKRCVHRTTSEFLVDNGFSAPTVFGFGHDDVQYDLSEFKPEAVDTFDDYSAKELASMQRAILKDRSKTKLIMQEVVELTKDRNAVLITGAGQKHLEEIAACLPEDSYFIITDKTGNKERKQGLKDIKTGKKKFILQVGCLTTGYSEPLIDTNVFLRKIGSLTLLIQLMGRHMRLLKQHHIDAGVIKEEGLVLDYTDTMVEMAELYSNPFIEQAAAEKAKQERRQDMKTCPKCRTLNAPMARRCINRQDEPTQNNFHIDNRCEFFWVEQKCPECGLSNDTCARECRGCHHQLFDPNKNLSRKHYTDADYVAVKSMNISLTSNMEGVLITYKLEDGGKATEFYYPTSKSPAAKRAWENRFLFKHMRGPMVGKMRGKHATHIVKNKAMFDAPTHITYRIKEDGKCTIGWKKFLSGREAK